MKDSEVRHRWWCEVSPKIDRATPVNMSRKGCEKESNKRKVGNFHRDNTTTPSGNFVEFLCFSGGLA